MGGALKFKQAQVVRQKGELARLKIVSGPDYGAVFVVLAPRVSIGRGENNDIVLADLKASRSHAQIQFGSGFWTIRDIGSANGILRGGQALREFRMGSREVFTVGETTLEFMAAEQGTQMLIAPPVTVEQVQSERALMAAQAALRRNNQPQVAGSISVPHGIGNGGDKQGFLEKMIASPLRLVTVLGVLVVLFFTGEEARQKPKKAQGEAIRDLSSLLPPEVELDPSISKTAESLFSAGFREFSQGNYLRARSYFEMVLQVTPNNKLAQRYRNDATQAIDEEVVAHLDAAKKGYEAGKLREARSHYAAVMRLLRRNQVKPEYIRAQEELKKIEKEMRKAKGGLG